MEVGGEWERCMPVIVNLVQGYSKRDGNVERFLIPCYLTSTWRLQTTSPSHRASATFYILMQSPSREIFRLSCLHASQRLSCNPNQEILQKIAALFTRSMVVQSYFYSWLRLARHLVDRLGQSLDVASRDASD
jgi:hypothetical protein